MRRRNPTGAWSRVVCLACGGAIKERRGDAAAPQAADIEDAAAAAELWIEHCTRRNRILQEAADTLGESVRVARTLAAWTRASDNVLAAARLEAMALEEEQYHRQVCRMIEDLEEHEPHAAR